MSCDNQDTLDSLFRLYQKGSLDLRTILDLLNIDLSEAEKILGRGFRELYDAQFNKTLRSAYDNVGKGVAEDNDLVEKIAAKLEPTKPEEDTEANVYSPELSTDFLERHACPACKGTGWTVLFMYRSNCELCKGEREVDGVVLREYQEDGSP